ncbi:MAG: septal ring lytic transglycosylase RlpA family protein [Hyphomonadaceae bacterium]
MLAGICVLAAFVVGSAADPAHAQTGAPIVYKSSAPTAPVMTASLDVPRDGMSLYVAPHAPIPTFSSPSLAAPAPLAASLGPVPPVGAAGEEQSSALRTVAPPASSALAAPYAGPPYQVDGKWYVPAHEPNYDEVGIASWYGPNFHGKASASGEPFDENAMTAAHPTLPIPSLVRVTNLDNGRSVVVRLNDRGPFVDDRIIDLSRAAAGALDMHGPGTARVRVQYVGPAPSTPNAAPSEPVLATPQTSQDIVGRQLAPLAAPAPAAASTPMMQPSGEVFFLQAGSFADLGNANKLRDRLRPVGLTTIKAVMVNGSEYYRVMLGPWPSRDAADRARQNLGASGIQTLVVAGNR